MCEKHKLKIDYVQSTKNYFLVFACSECGFIYVLYRIMLYNQMLSRDGGLANYEGLIYRAWNPYEFIMEDVNAN